MINFSFNFGKNLIKFFLSAVFFATFNSFSLDEEEGNFRPTKPYCLKETRFKPELGDLMPFVWCNKSCVKGSLVKPMVNMVSKNLEKENADLESVEIAPDKDQK